MRDKGKLFIAHNPSNPFPIPSLAQAFTLLILPQRFIEVKNWSLLLFSGTHNSFFFSLSLGKMRMSWCRSFGLYVYCVAFGLIKWDPFCSWLFFNFFLLKIILRMQSCHGALQFCYQSWCWKGIFGLN